MRSRVFILLLTGFLFTLAAVSQQDPKNISDRSTRASVAMAEPGDNTELNRIVTTGGGPLNIPLGEEGSLYLRDDFVPGTIILADNMSLDRVPLRYDVYHQQMQFIKEGDTMAIANPTEIDLVSLDDKLFIYHAFEKDKVIDTGIFEVLVDGSCKLLRRYRVDYHLNEGHSDENGFIKSTHLYVSKKGDPAIEMAPSRKSVCSFFEDRNEEVRDFIKTNHLRMSRYDDVMMVVEFYNSLKKR